MNYLPPDSPTLEHLLELGDPFVPFSEFSIQAIHHPPDGDFSAWIRDRLQEGKPFVIRGFKQSSHWDNAVLNNGTLATLSVSGAIPVRNCQTGRDVKMRLRDLLSLADHARASNIRELLYAKDLHCPTEWITALDKVIPPCLRHLGSLDLFRVLPKETAPEVLMAYVGTRKSFSGFHRCFSGTVALNLMVESEGTGPGSLCFGTDTISQEKYDKYMGALGKESHTDWANVSISRLQSADFPIYVTYQKPGDLVVFPAATAHQIWNISPMVTKVVWNIMHTSSLTSFFDYVQPIYQKQCHADTGRVPLIPVHGLKSQDASAQEKSVALEVFQRLVEDEDTGSHSPPIKLVDTQGAVVECNFCGLTIWNRHMHCEQCGDFDLCLTCFVSGRSCRHVADYAWAELFPMSSCQTLLSATRDALRQENLPSRQPLTTKTLGSLAVDAANLRRQANERLCHLCRDSHPIWKGTTCSQCSAFFCLRGLHRHFDIDLFPFLRNENAWLCPKCTQICNCRCCHFAHPYQGREKPVRSRVKPVDARGRIPGFIDNVFDQKRGKRASLAASSASPQPMSRGRKRPRKPDDDGGGDDDEEDDDNGNPDDYGESRTPGELARPFPRGRRPDGPKPSGAMRPPGRLTGHSHAGSQLRISDLVENRSHSVGEMARPPSQAAATRHGMPSPLASENAAFHPTHETSDRDSAASTNPEDSIASLEKKVESLRQYAGDLLELSLVESHAKLQERINRLEGEIEHRRRQKAEWLFGRLHREFPDLADLAMDEARRRGL
ncbi:hypothetical protein FE257_007989 [Aspergillus nanangensis]|uniref:JmjC domain-containing protein n=1 Tax=Aspergillus nanangensis TaxID=2582783 RepID=A0AAD4CME5_ASPNN|nr:hypothetical protein FE257_007989 [Aspergillus nanangensis]